MTPLREQLARPGAFVVAAEVVTSRGLITASSSRKVLELARELAANERIDVLSITDNPGGHAMLAPDTLGTDLVSRGQEVIIHLSCKDWNRNALESRGWKLGSEGFDNVLALSGDYPVTGHKGLAAPVFDIDSVGLLSLYAEMNEGLRDTRRPDTRLDRTNFFLGCVVTNHKRREREVMPQYFKLRKKIECGARFAINQIGWDTRKDDELLRWLRHDGLSIPVLANVYLLSRTAARAFHAGKIPGAIVTDELLARVEREAASADKGRAFFVELAAKHVAVSRGLGFAGVYLGGHMPPATFGEILDRAASFAPDDWRELAREIQYPFSDEFYFFARDAGDGALVGRDRRGVPGVEEEAKDGVARPAEVQVQPPAARSRLRARGAVVPHRSRSLPRDRKVTGADQGCPRCGAGGQGAALQVSRLRRLLTARDRLRLPRVAVREEPAQRAVRRHTRGALRGLRHRVHLVPGLRAAEGLRRGGVDAGRPGRRQGQRIGADECLGEHVPRPRPPGAYQAA